MSTGGAVPPDKKEAELAALIETLHTSDQRLDELTSGEVDTVSDRRGRTSLLRRAQDQMRLSDANRQRAILNALPAHIAVLDRDGIIVSVNDGWRAFAKANALSVPEYGVGASYLDACDRALGRNSSEAQRVGIGLRAVLDGSAAGFSIEYPCHAPTQRRWFMMMATPMPRPGPGGAVVMHLDVTSRKLAEESQDEAESRFRQMAESIDDVFFLRDASTFFYVSPAYPTIWGRSRESLYAEPESWANAIHPDDRAMAMERNSAGMQTGRYELEFRIVRPDGSMRWIEARVFPVADAGGKSPRIAGIAKDITERKRGEAELRRFVGAMDAIADALYLVDRASMRFVHVNDAACRMRNMSRAELLGLAPEAGLPMSREELERIYDTVIKSGVEAPPLETPYKRDDGTQAWQELRRHAQFAGGSWTIVTLVRDVTERRQAQDRIVYLNRVYAVLSGINALIVRERDRDRMFNEACRIAVESGGFRMAWIGVVDRVAMRLVPVAVSGVGPGFIAGIQDQFPLEVTGPHQRTMTVRAVMEKRAIVDNDVRADSGLQCNAQGLQGGALSIAVLPLLVDDEAVGVFVLYATESGFFRDDELKLLTGLSGDISLAVDRMEKQARLDYLAYYDVLTGLANRGLFLERVAQYVRSAASGGHELALVMIDLERFKNINDSLGRAAGDALLKQVADWLTLNAGDAGLLARIGADHFAAVLPVVKPGGNLVHLVESTTQAFLQHPFHLEGAVFRVAARVGIAVYPADGLDAESLFRNAESALKRAKAGGERYLFHTQSMTEAVAGKLTLENQLRQALDNGEFVLHYQPKIELLHGRLTGAEALIRWNDPTTGLVPPGRFIPVLEEIGLIHEVGRWALRQAIKDYLRWRSVGLPAVRVAVNVSPMQLRDRGFAAEIEQMTGVDEHAAAGLELEITESLIMEDARHSIDSLRAIRALGVTIAIDDFGTGFSSLSYLAKLPVDTLKIDRTFVIDMTAGPQGLALVSTIIDLAHSLRLQVVAEGVEFEEQSRLLRLLGCDQMQGFLISTPVPVLEFEARFLARGAAGQPGAAA